MKWASSLSENPRLESALKACATEIQDQLQDAKPDLCAVFVSHHHANQFDSIPSFFQDRFPAVPLLGCSAGGVIGNGLEVEERTGVSLVAASLPDVKIHPFAVQDSDLPDGDAPPRSWESLVGVRPAEEPQFLILADPFSIHADQFLNGLDYAFPNAAKIGGLASGATEPKKNALFLNHSCLRQGLVGLALSGNLRLDTVVAQGCRPIGQPLRITDCQENILLTVEGRPPLEVLQDIVEELPESDRNLLRHSLFLGIALDPTQEDPSLGDFLIRNIIGADNEHGYLAVAALIRTGQRVQFHVRDAGTSREDLTHLLSQVAAPKASGSGALLFSCQGRGEGLYGQPHHDSQLFREKMGPLPVGGFFCSGEIGPVGGTTHLHGYTSCFGIFRPKEGST